MCVYDKAVWILAAASCAGENNHSEALSEDNARGMGQEQRIYKAETGSLAEGVEEEHKDLFRTELLGVCDRRLLRAYAYRQDARAEGRIK